MDANTEHKLSTFLQSSTHWGWPSLFLTFGPKVALVTDPGFRDIFEGYYKGLKCTLLSTEEIFAKALPKPVHTVIIFLRAGEKRVTQKIKADYPDKRILSAQYDIAPQCHRPIMQMAGLKTQKHTLDRLPVTQKPVLLLSEPGSDAEYLASLMAMNNLPRPLEYGGLPIIDLLSFTDNFKPFSFISRAYGYSETEDNFAIHLQSDVLSAIFDHMPSIIGQLTKLIKKSQAHIIYVKRHNKLAQATLNQLMEDKPLRSLWTMPKGRRDNFPGQVRVNIPQAIKIWKNTAREKQLLESLLSDFPNKLSLTTEAIAAAPTDAIKTVADHIGHQAPTTIRSMNYSDAYNDTLNTEISRFSHDIIDRIGLHT